MPNDGVKSYQIAVSGDEAAILKVFEEIASAETSAGHNRPRNVARPESGRLTYQTHHPFPSMTPNITTAAMPAKTAATKAQSRMRMRRVMRQTSSSSITRTWRGCLSGLLQARS